ncbi:ABC transporter permease [Polycladidibacter hongkongensis]|uniref:ABC transporter permease n=1 Tax=Polycladidibacter hongkongensis TaxID=1647556 RepID=UPI00082DB628|nr:ABC transporter permease [Pseudovibrio hongkongensis]
MWRYLARRSAIILPTLLVISLLVFLIIELPQGDYISNQIAQLRAIGEEEAIAKLEFLRKEFALDQPFLLRYLIWLGAWPGPSGFDGLLQGNFGWSFEYQQPVWHVVAPTLPLTMLLNGATILFVYLISFPIGVFVATRQYTLADYLFTLLGYLGLATPNFLLALILMYLGNVWFDISVGGLMVPEYIGAPLSIEKAISVALHLITPIIVIGTAGTAAMIRRLRANMLDELGQQYVITARAKGLSERQLIWKYPLRVAINPFIADIGNLMPALVSGSVIVSVVLNLPTVGPVLLSALAAQDQFLAAFVLMFVSALTLLGMLLSDVLLAFVDPRIRLGAEARR